MAFNSKVEWTDHTFNPWRGCQKVSAGCDHCYAETMSARNPQMLGQWGPLSAGGTRIVAADQQWKALAAWAAKAFQEGVRRRVFCASLADVWEDWRGDMRDWDGSVLRQGEYNPLAWGRDASGPPLTMDLVRARLMNAILKTPALDWLLLSKRPENALNPALVMWQGTGWPGLLTNVWLGVTAENQEEADRRVPRLLAMPGGRVKFLSCEPLLGPLDLSRWLGPDGVRWVIVGGESGPKARPCDTAWITAVLDQCRAANVPCFVKQLGRRPIKTWANLPGRSLALDLSDPKGGDPAEWPIGLRSRAVPETT